MPTTRPEPPPLVKWTEPPLPYTVIELDAEAFATMEAEPELTTAKCVPVSAV